MSREAFEPCPFCGATMDRLDAVEGSTFRWMRTECPECGAQGPEVRVQTLGEGTREEWRAQGVKEAIAAWNRRAQVPADRDAVLEEAAVKVDAERAEFMPQAANNNGSRESDFAFGSVNSAERIAAAIRAMKGTP